jgi:hypothetical protein
MKENDEMAMTKKVERDLKLHLDSNISVMQLDDG